MKAQCQNCILGVKWFSGCSEEGDHEVYSICYILRKSTLAKKNSDKINATKTVFSLRSSNPHHNILFNFHFFYRFMNSRKVCIGFPFFFSIWVLLKFIFTLREFHKTVNLLKKGKKLIGIHSTQGWTATARARSYKKKIKAQKDLSNQKRTYSY